MRLRIEQKIVVAGIHRKIADIVGDHAVHPALPVAPGHQDLGPPRKVVHRATFAKLAELGRRVAERHGSFGPQIFPHPGPAGRQLVIQNCLHHRNLPKHSIINSLRGIEESGTGDHREGLLGEDPFAILEAVRAGKRHDENPGQRGMISSPKSSKPRA